LLASAFFLAAVPTLAQSPDWLDTLNGELCPNDSEFTCVTITVPLDHFDPNNSTTIDVAFAVLPASEASRGLFVTATGGPGTSGVGLADYYTSYVDESVLENYDIVFYDQRGIGLSGGLDCPNAAAAYALVNARPLTPEGEAGTLDAAKTFAQNCQSEMGSPELLGYISTDQAVQDLEAFRRVAGDQRIWLYGESYGTQYAQTYAAAYPENIGGLILDGVVDMTLESTDFYTQQTQAFNDVLTRSLEACNANAACAADMGTDAVAFYDDLAAELLAAPATFSFPLADGTSETRAFDINMLETAALNTVYGRPERADFLRELAAGAQGDLLPLAREFYLDAGVNPFTYAPVIDPTYFTSMYYAVECGDYNFFSGTPDERGSAFIQSGNATDASIPRLSIIYYTDLPCVYWDFATPPIERPTPLTGGAYVTFVLNSSTDPATPTSNGYAVYDRLVAAGSDAYMITMEGGPHVLFGRGETCPDVAITAWMVDGVLPISHEYICPGSVIGDYLPLNPPTFAEYLSPLDAIQAVDEEIQLLPEYIGWDIEGDLPVGCPYGGSVTFSPTDDGETFTLDDCAMIDGFALNGTATYDYDVEISFVVVVNGNPDDFLIYTYDLATDMYTIEGTFGGEPVMTPRLLN
jgi:pimeloyl-ACP methyl ester carboxylesterase